VKSGTTTTTEYQNTLVASSIHENSEMPAGMTLEDGNQLVLGVEDQSESKWQYIDRKGRTREVASTVFIVNVEKEKDVQMSLCFQVTDVKKPLVAVTRICEKGNRVCFGPNEADNYIQSVRSGDQIYMRKQRGSFVIDGQFGDGEWKDITIDSAAEESVCPKDWGKQFGTVQVEEDKKLRFVSANGGKIEHYGERKVVLNTKSTF